MDKASYIFEVEAELDDGLDVAGDKIGHLALGCLLYTSDAADEYQRV